MYSNDNKLIKEILYYYTNTTGLSTDNFILNVQRNFYANLGELTNQEWLAVKSYQLLKENGFNLADCIELKNSAVQMKQELKGMNLTSLWKKKISECINSNDINEYEFFELSNDNSELRYLSSQLSKDCNVLKNISKDENFYNTFDFDMNNKNAKLFKMLPFKIQEAIQNEYPIYLNFNPFLENNKNFESLYDELKLYGFSDKVYLNPFIGGLYKIICFCRDYNIKKLRLGFYSPLDMFYEDSKYLEFYNFFREQFIFKTGVCFSPEDLGVKNKSENISYMIWDLKEKKDKTYMPIVLKKYVQESDDQIVEIGSILVSGKRESLYDWVKNNSNVIIGSHRTEIPVYYNIQTRLDYTIVKGDNVLGFQTYPESVLKSIKKLCISSVPIGDDYIEITENNLLNTVASFAVRSCLSAIELSKTPYLSKPEIRIEGYKNWLANALIYFVYSINNLSKSYREKDLILTNKFFPLFIDEVKENIVDANILRDLDELGIQSGFSMVYNSSLHYASESALELHYFCRKKILESLQGDIRSKVGYKDSLVAWDAGWCQVRGIDGFFTAEDETRYSYLLSKARDDLMAGGYRFGMIN